MPTENDKPAIVLVTGASTGLGLAIARAVVEAPSRYRAILTARKNSLSRLTSQGIVESDRCHLYEMDVTSDADRRRVIADVQEKFGSVDVLVNNAGVSYRTVVEYADSESLDCQMQTNFRAPLELTRLVLPAMRKNKRGKIINVSSVAGMMAMPTMGIYSASKFALEGASESLWYEVRPFGISVTLVQPGFIHSASFQRVLFTSDSRASLEKRSDDYHPHHEFMGPFIEKLMRLSPATPEKVARVVLRVIESKDPPLRVPATPDAVLFSWLRRLMPRGLYHRALYRLLPGVRQWRR